MSEDKSEGLKACPFCGHGARVYNTDLYGKLYNCGCSNFHCPVSPQLILDYETELGAIRAWNTRDTSLLDWVLERAKGMTYATNGSEYPPMALAIEDLETISNEAKRKV